MTLFQPQRSKNVDQFYTHYSTCKSQQDVRDFVDKMYSDVRVYLGDTNFEKMLQTDFHATVWQLYVTWTFFAKGRSKLAKAKTGGPDVILEDGTIIEAVTVKRGNGEDKPFSWEDVQPVEKYEFASVYPPRVMDYPDTKIILRIASAIKSKTEQHERWVANGIVRPDQPFVIAVNAGLIDEAADNSSGSYVSRVAFALGEEVLVVPVNLYTGGADLDKTSVRVAHRPLVTKKSGNGVCSDLFLSDKYSAISGLLFSPYQVGRLVTANPDDLEYVSNGFARFGLPRELIQGIRYTWAEIDEKRGGYRVFSEPKTHS